MNLWYRKLVFCWAHKWTKYHTFDTDMNYWRKCTRCGDVQMRTNTYWWMYSHNEKEHFPKVPKCSIINE